MEPENGLLDKYVLDLVPKKRPKICFMGTASNDGKEYRDMFYNFFEQMQCEPSHLALTHPPRNIESFIMDKDIIHVGGGNTKLIIETWKKFGVDKMMRRAWNAGVILTGMSAGAICWFQDGITNPAPGSLSRLPCLGLLSGSFCPHYEDREELKREYHKLILDGSIGEGFGVEDGAALHFADSQLIRVVTSRPTANAYRVRKVRNKIVEEHLEKIYLGKESDKMETINDMQELDVLKTAISFVEKINDHDIDAMQQLMSSDHVFTDSLGMVIKGKDEMKEAWTGFFNWFPDYEITIRHTLLTNDTVGIFGKAKGIFNTEDRTDADKFEIPAAWRAKIKNNLITEWQVFADNESVRDIIKGNGARAILKEMKYGRLRGASHRH